MLLVAVPSYLPPIPQLQAIKAANFAARGTILPLLSYPFAVDLDSIVAAIDGLAGISNSAMSLLMIAELEDHVARLEQPTELR